MYLKSRTGLLPAFQPYDSLQATLAHLTGSEVHPIIPWAMSFLNGSTILGLCFGRIYAWLPGNSGAAKGATFGIFGWLAMGFVFFPLVGLGLFAGKLNLGVWPAVFSLAMMLAYSVVLGVVYAALNSWGEVVPPRAGIKPNKNAARNWAAF